MLKLKKNNNCIIIGCDHAGFSLKKSLIECVKNLGFEVIDVGCFDGKNSCSYVQISYKLVCLVKRKKCPGILICGSGVGVSIAANRFSHIRAALCGNAESANLARSHNNANVICLAARTTSVENAQSAVEEFLKIKFSSGRHLSRVQSLCGLSLLVAKLKSIFCL